MRAVVLGAGIAGLATAHALRRRAEASGRPIELLVLEASGRAGGRIRTTREDGYLIEWAANAIQGAEGPAWRVAGEVGLAEERMLARPDAARRYIARHGRLHLVPLSPGAFLRFGAISPGGKLRIALEPFYARRVSHDETVHQYASRHIGEEAATALVGAAVRGIFAGDVRKLSVDSAFPIMREMERDHRSLVFAMVAAMRKARREGRSVKAPAAAAAGPGRRTLWGFTRGMESLAEALAASLGPSLRLNTPALAVERGAGGGYSVLLANGERVLADAVILATPPRATAAILRGLDAEAARLVGSIGCAGLTVVGMAFRPEAFRRPPDGYGFLVSPGEDLEILGVLFESNLFPGRAPEGRLLVRGMVGGAERPDLITRSDAELVGLVMQALDRVIGMASGPERTWIIRQENAIAQYPVGHRATLEKIAARLAALPGIHVTGNAYRGVSVGSLLEDAERTAERALGAGQART